MKKLKHRVVIASDEDGNWFVRRLKFVSHDLDADEKVYRCDQPIGVRFKTVEEAAKVAKQFLGIDTE